MIQFTAQSPAYLTDDSCQPQFSHPHMLVAARKGAPLLSWSGLGIIHQLVERLGVAAEIDSTVRVMQRCKWYTESDHALTLVYNLLTGGDTLNAINRLRSDAGLRRLLGDARIPHATTVGDFLARFAGKREHQEQRNLPQGELARSELREACEQVQQRAFRLLPQERRRVATLDWDSSIHEVYGEKKEGADYAYDKRWSYSALYGTLAETGDVLHLGLEPGCRHTSYGVTKVLPGTIERVQRHFREVRVRADSGYYQERIARICEQREVEFFIVAPQRQNLMKAVWALPESAWRPYVEPVREPVSGRRRKKRGNVKRKITLLRQRKKKRKVTFKGKPEVAEMQFQPRTWKKGYRYVIKRTPIIDRNDQQLYLDDGLREYVYWIVVTNARQRSAPGVLRMAQGRGNQENLIKDLKQGLGLDHVPTGLLGANQAYFMIAALAWNLKTWMLNLLNLGDGAVLRCKRFLYLWMCQAGVVAKTGRGCVLLKLPAGEYYQRFSAALGRLAAL